MSLLTETVADILVIGDVLRLPENYDLGPGSAPVDLIVFEPNKAGTGLGLLTISGYKAGLVYAVLPEASLPVGKRAIDIRWIKENWNQWFCYEYGEGMRVIDMGGAKVIAWNERRIMEAGHADGRTA